jgi:hypothetical protein
MIVKDDSVVIESWDVVSVPLSGHRLGRNGCRSCRQAVQYGRREAGGTNARLDQWSNSYQLLRPKPRQRAKQVYLCKVVLFMVLRLMPSIDSSALALNPCRD